ncbi:MAG TPA: hypothetical protein VF116_01485 [Ktedonobacterales bacterium]
MNDPQHRAELADRVEQRRRELHARSDISQAMRKLSAASSNHRNTLDALPKKRSAKITMILVGAGAVAVLAVVLTIATFAFLSNQLSDPTSTAENYFSALHDRDYQQAYGYLTASAQDHLTESAFANTYASLDTTTGIVDSYTVKTSTTNGNRGTIVMIIVRRGNTSVGQVQTLSMLKENGNWRIDAITLGATVPAPTPNG